ncbi:hypothetical protein B5C34_01905 [Pacificimonas flava]|uniref:UPF0145 protein B5C34_01905 n=2 Tax=Pacificimonas TaxID=1960290 RepID=A0A219B3D1_9SPHN|nr:MULTISPECIES: heavy metal-binding domain-containing protein [Pacificimonas]MBZ6378027.1 heavy metal-binding domain-containing protein [Pacificimonas aurantium]OWV32328.1 hypothetical protein B5C34_01905 [Pacificimonas flava]
MIVTTTPSVEGRTITEYHGVVAGEAIMGANIFRDLFAGITDILGGRSGSYEKVLQQGRSEAIEDMKYVAAQYGADAIVGVDIDYEVLGKEGSMLMVSASGTAVSLSGGGRSGRSGERSGPWS